MLRTARTAFQLSDGTVENLVQNSAGESLDGFALLGREIAEPAAEALQFSLADEIHPLLQRQDGGHHLARRQPARHLLHLFAYDRLRPNRFPLALLHIGVD